MHLLSAQFCQIFLEAKALLIHLRGVIAADIAVVPGLKIIACDLGFVGGVAEDKAVLMGMILEPSIGLGLAEGDIGFACVVHING